MDAAHSFRLFLKNHMTPPKSKDKTKIIIIEKPNAATIWIAKTFPRWQSIVLTTMKELYNVRNLFLFSEYIILIFKILNFLKFFNSSHLYFLIL